MRIRIIAPIALAAITLLAGCNRNAPNANGTNTGANTGTTANASPLATPTVAQPSPTATTTTSASTPTEALNAYVEAIKRQDPDAFKSLLSKGTLSMLEERAERDKATLNEVLKGGLAEAKRELPATAPQSRNEKIDGDKATLEVNDEKRGGWDTLHFVKEGGQWKISFDEREWE